MGLAAILGLYLLSAGWSPPAVRGPLLQTAGQSPAATPSEKSTLSPSGQTANPPAQAKPSASRPRHRKKTASNCSNAPTALNTAVAKPVDSANSTDPGSTNAGSTIAGPTGSKPCPPPKKVVRNGGSNEPEVQLTGGTTAQRASDKSSTEQLKAATEENLKKAAGLQLSSSQQEMVNQIKEFMEQSKAAVAAGDLERGHNLALKANLLSDELVKP
jgi:hypothetical protein